MLMHNHLKYRCRSLSLFFVVVLVGLSPGAATAATPEELEGLPDPERCSREFASLGAMLKRRDQGMSREDATQLAARTNGIPISERAVALAFDFPAMPFDGFALYTFWTCKSLAYGLPIVPLSQVAEEMQTCYSKPVEARRDCAPGLMDKVIGLPEGYRASRPPARVFAPPALSPTEPTQTSNTRSAGTFCKMSAPQVPRAAVKAGISGTVVAEFIVQHGKVTEILKITGPEVFYPSVEAAIRRYDCRSLEKPVTATQAFDFKVE